MKIYVLCHLCDDSFYSGHIANQRQSFTDEKTAQEVVKSLNGEDADEDYYYYEEIELK